MSFLGSAGPPNPPRPPQTPPMVQGGQKWLKCTCTSPVLIINDKKTTFGGMNILTYFFTRNVPYVTLAEEDNNSILTDNTNRAKLIIQRQKALPGGRVAEVGGLSGSAK